MTSFSQTCIWFNLACLWITTGHPITGGIIIGLQAIGWVWQYNER